MNIATNEPLVKRNTRIAQVTMIGGLAVLAGGMFISFRMPERFTLSLAALMVGFLLSQIGIYYSNRWARRPRTASAAALRPTFAGLLTFRTALLDIMAYENFIVQW